VTYAFILLDNLGHLCEALVIHPVYASKASDGVTSSQAGLIGWASGNNAIDLRKRCLHHCSF